MTRWSDKRLRRLFDRYDGLYFRGRLAHYRLKIKPMPDALGLCEWGKRTITIDVAQHKSDRELRGTVLHEMAHAAVRPRGQGHDVYFFEQVERLLQKRAPITVNTPEVGGVRIMANLVPARFPLLKRKIDRVEARRSSKLEALFKSANAQVRQVTEGEILRRFEDAAWELSWKRSLVVVGPEYALTDECGRPLTARARELIAKGKKVHRRARRDYLESEKLRAAFENAASPPKEI